MPFYAKPKNQRFPQKFVPVLADRPLILIAFFNARQTRPETSEAFSFHLSPYRYLSSTHNRSTLPARSTAHWVIITANEKKPRLFSHTGTTNRQKHWGTLDPSGSADPVHYAQCCRRWRARAGPTARGSLSDRRGTARCWSTAQPAPPARRPRCCRGREKDGRSRRRWRQHAGAAATAAERVVLVFGGVEAVA